MSLPVMTVHLDNPVGKGATVTLDGHDISGGLMELDIHFKAGELTTARMVIGVGALEIDAPTLALLQANVEVKEPAIESEAHPEMRAFGADPLSKPHPVDVTTIGSETRTYV